jgi:hypothetical protein
LGCVGSRVRSVRPRRALRVVPGRLAAGQLWWPRFPYEEPAYSFGVKVVEVQADMPALRLKRSHASLSALAEMGNTVSRMRGMVRMMSVARPELW